MNRAGALDILKLVMALMVVGIHTRFLVDVNFLGYYLSVNGLFRIAVPFFFMASGFYFFATVSRNGQVDWFKRIILLYAIWMVFYSPYWAFTPDKSFIGLQGMALKLVVGYFHLWYLVGMLGAAIIVFTLRNMHVSLLLLSVVLAFLVGVFIQYAGNYHIYDGTVFDRLFNHNSVHRNAAFFAYPFFCLGYLIAKFSIHKRVSLHLTLLLAAIGSVALLGESYVNFRQSGGDGDIDNYMTLLLLCPFVFIASLKVSVDANTKFISQTSAVIYFSHILFVNIFKDFFDLNRTELTVYVICASLLASYPLIKANQKLKVIL